MAVIISKENTTLNTPNGFHQVESYNIGPKSEVSASLQALTITRYVNVTFANPGNCLGVLWLLTTTSMTSRELVTRLEEAKSMSVSIASPAQVTADGHGMLEGQAVVFATSDSLPSGITVGTIYYVRNPGTDTFNISTTPTGSLVNTSGTQSGTHTLWVERAVITQSTTDICGSGASGSYANYGNYYVPSIFSTPYPVDVVASKWRFDIRHGSGTGTWNLNTSDNLGANIIYAAWCDNETSFSDDDVVIVKNYVTIDKTASIGAVLGAGEDLAVLANGTGLVICSNSQNPDPDNVCYLCWENPPTAPHTLTLKGAVTMGKYGGFRIGSSTAPIPLAQKATLTFTSPMVGTTQPRFRPISVTSTSYDYSGSGSFFIYGEKPNFAKTNLAGDALTGQAHLTTADSVDWTDGDQVVIGKQDGKDQGDLTVYTVSSVSGNDITLTSNILTRTRKAGATILKLGGFGVKIQHDTSYCLNYIYTPANFIIDGCELYNVMFSTTGTSYYYVQSALLASNRSQHLIRDVVAWTNSNSNTYVLSPLVSPDGCLLERVYGWRMNMASGAVAYYANLHFSNRLTIKDCVCLSHYAGTTSTSTNIRLTLDNNRYENARSTYFFAITGINGEFKNNYLWGSGTTTSGYGAVYITQCTSPLEISNNIYNNNICAMVFGPAVTVKCVDTNSVFGDETANTADIGFALGAFPDYVFQSPTGNLTINETYVSDMIIGGRVGFSEVNDILNNDRSLLALGKFERTGSGLTDTTVRTSGVDKFAMRFQPTNASQALFWSQDIPTGNIQNQTIIVTCFVKINHTNYYSGNHINPTLRVVYDGNQLASATATDTTDWQSLFVSLTPATIANKIIVTIEGATDSLGAESYFYLDDMSVYCPGGVKLNLGGLDIWDNGLPLMPSIQFISSAKNNYNFSKRSSIISS